MIPSAKIAILPSPPPENRFSSPSTLLPPKFFWIALTAVELIPGAGMWVPRRYSASMAAVNSTLLRISPTLNAPRIVPIIASALGGVRRLGRRLVSRLLDHLTAPAGRLDLLARCLAEPVGVNGERLGQLGLGQHLDDDPSAGRQSLAVHRLKGHGRTRLKARLQVEQVHHLGLRAEGLKRHRLLHVRAAQLSHPHVDRVLAALEACPALGARARAPALLPATRGLARARALSAPDALAWPARA